MSSLRDDGRVSDEYGIFLFSETLVGDHFCSIDFSSIRRPDFDSLVVNHRPPRYCVEQALGMKKVPRQ